jgi:hypothetical protein
VEQVTTQDGYDWPAGCTDERWPAEKHQPATPYFRWQLAAVATQIASEIADDMLKKQFRVPVGGLGDFLP